MKRILSILLICLMLTSVAYAGNTSIVEYTSVTDEGVTTVTATALANDAANDVKLFTAVYNADGSFAGAKKASSKDSALLKNSVTLGEGQTVKSFTWEGNENTPVEAIATYGKTFTESDVEITFGGASFEEHVGAALSFDATDNVAEYTVKLGESNAGEDGNITIPVPEVKVKDNGMYYDVDIDEEYLVATIKIMSGRTVTYDDSYTSMSKETYAPARCETIVINYEMNMFTEDMIISDPNEVDFNGNKTDYDNVYTWQVAETVTNSEAIAGKTAVLSALSVDGVAVEGFSPDVFEYNVTVPAAQVSMPKVAYVPAGDAVASAVNTYELPGKTVITVTEAGTTNTYTINYALSTEELATNVAFKDSSIVLKNPMYVPGGVEIGTKAYVDRTNATNYDIQVINDSRLVGADLIRGSIDCYGSLNSVYEGDAIPDWISLDAARGVEVVILTVGIVGKANFEDNSYTRSTNSDGFIKTYTNGEKVFDNAYSRHFEAGSKVTIPNVAGDASHTMLVALIWDDWAPITQDITITADKFFKATMILLVPKDKSQDTIVVKEEDGTYSPVTWAESKVYATDDYDYETDEEGNIVYNEYDDNRATGRKYASNIVTMTSGGTAVENQAFKKLTGNDGHYIYGSQNATNRYPKSSNRMTLINVPEEYAGSNGIVYAFSGSGHIDISLTFSANDNLDKVVIWSIDAITGLKANDEAVFTKSTPATEDMAYYMYQGITSGHVYQAEFTMSYHLAKGNMYSYDAVSTTSTTIKPEGYTYYIQRRVIADFLKANVVLPDPDKMSEELYTLASTYNRDGWRTTHKWFLGEVGFEAQSELVENITYLGPESHDSLRSDGSIQTHTNPVPKIIDFTVAAYSDRVDNVTSASGNKAGEPLSYPAWLEVGNATYIAGAYEWTSLPGCANQPFEAGTALDWYTFTVSEDACIMYVTNNAPDDFWATEADGWSKVVLEGDDMVNICRTKTRADCFTYNNLFVKDVKAGETVTIKTAMVKQSIPLVFVKPANK